VLLPALSSAEALGAFAKALREHGGDPSQIEAIAMDMSPAYRARLRVIDAGVYQRPAAAVVDQIDVNMIESKRERQPNPEDTRGNLS
jgi:ABC-type nitrate/sulfonate/bicarbonate transport system substrate-binding protein